MWLLFREGPKAREVENAYPDSTVAHEDDGPSDSIDLARRGTYAPPHGARDIE